MEWNFPGQAVSIPPHVSSDPHFQEQLAIFLEQASLESVKEFAAVTQKACAPQPEIRDTADPALITGLFMAILEANGSTQGTTFLRKRVRDTVSFDSARKPWRRSALYLVVRVAVQRHLYRLFGPETGRLYYKCIVCMFLSNILSNGFPAFPHESTHNLRQKLGQRVAKLEVGRNRSCEATQQVYDHVLRRLRPILKRSLSDAVRFLDSQWEAFKRRTLRPIERLPGRAAPSDMNLLLPLSGEALRQALCSPPYVTQSEKQSPAEFLGQYEKAVATNSFSTMTKRYIPLCDFEQTELQSAQEGTKLSSGPHERCIRLADMIKAYITETGNAYFDYPELLSKQLLNLMELWVDMDRSAVACYHHLADFHPIFHAAMFDVLQLVTSDELMRLQQVESYLSTRYPVSEDRPSRTIFDTPSEASFSSLYYDNSSHSQALKNLRREIEEYAERFLAAKEAEWHETSRRHEKLIHEIAGLSCIFVTELDEDGIARRVHKRGCEKHRLKWEAKQIKIGVFEYPLPCNEPAAKAVIFELACPDAFAAYRDATWLVLSTFTLPKAASYGKVPLLRTYSQLRDLATQKTSMVTLGSYTKSHLGSHYSSSDFPITLSQICRPFGLSLDYYDSSGRQWVSNRGIPSLRHLFPLKLSSLSPYFPFKQTCDGLTSNRVLANQPNCPADINIHEYTAWQNLLIGTHCRWLSLLREMGSTHLNFSTDSTWALVSRLILQVGPSSSGDFLRDIHVVFRDKSFCERLLEQVNYRLTAIRHNFREPHQMDTLISILLKMADLSTSVEICAMAENLLKTAGKIAWGWYTKLQLGGHEQTLESSHFAIWAAVLFKRTFYHKSFHSLLYNYVALQEFIGASIGLQNSLSGLFDTLPYNLRNAILQDLIISFKVRHTLHERIIAKNSAFLKALNDVWPFSNDHDAKPLPTDVAEKSLWTILIISSARQPREYCIHYNPVTGALLIDGEQLSNLPQKFGQPPILKELFGTWNLKGLRSPLPGMSFMVSRPMPYGHWVHLGLQNNKLVVRATHRRTPSQETVIEYISREMFRPSEQMNSKVPDLPEPLVDECYHWLDVSSGLLEIRQKDPWKSKRGNWKLNIRTGRATRKSSVLVDINSVLASKVIRNFEFFEDPQHIMVFQPDKGALRVEIKRLELSFEVVGGLLHCPQLKAMIPTSQDAGTWYGLQSKLLVSSTRNPNQRSILVPLPSNTSHEKDGQYVLTRVQNGGAYMKFGIDTLLGRVESPAEPSCLYARALWHASTSHFLPDPLTGRTGVEEALFYLNSGAYLPWEPLLTQEVDTLLRIARLSPRRVYYPPNLKCMETVYWNLDLPIFFQDDRYRHAIEQILQRTLDLSLFSHVTSHRIPLCPEGNLHLERRALSRSYAFTSKHRDIYEARDRNVVSRERSSVYMISKTLSRWSPSVKHPPQLDRLLQQFSIIGGYGRDFDKIQLTDLLNIELDMDWGALTGTALKSCEKEKYRLMFLFSPMAFSSKVPIQLIRCLVSFATIPEMKKVIPPPYPVFSHFKPDEVPDVTKIMQVTKSAEAPFMPPKHRPNGQYGQLIFQRLVHEEETAKSCKKFAESILAQWPNQSLDMDRLEEVEAKYFNRIKGYNLVVPEWKRLAQNFELSTYIRKVQFILNRHSFRSQKGDPSPKGTSAGVAAAQARSPHFLLFYQDSPRVELPDTAALLEKDILAVARALPTLTSSKQTLSMVAQPNGVNLGSHRHTTQTVKPEHISEINFEIPQHVQELQNIVFSYRESQSPVQKRYGLEMEHSISALIKHISRPRIVSEPFNPTKLRNQIFVAREVFHSRLVNK